jgi:ABC-type phosphate transport system substrate-binding protein
MRHAFGNTRMKLVAGAVLLCLASVASAQSAVLVGGGATLPAVGYANDTSVRLMTPGTGSMLAAYNAANGVSSTYCQTGSGGGKNVLIGATRSGITGPDAANVACVVPGPTDPIGFGGTGTLTQPNFVGSDSPIASAEYAAYMVSPAHTATGSSPVQIPSVAGAVAIIFNKPEIDQLKLSETQVCQIFSGQIKHWQDGDLASAITLKAGRSLAPGDMNIVYRSDGSGTTFSLTNHLSAKCGPIAAPPTGTNGNGVATLFTTNQLYTLGASAYFPAYALSTGASGNPAVVNTILANTGAIGYAETANSLQGNGQRALVANDATPTSFIDPATFGNPLAVTVTFDKVIGANDVNGRPTLASLPSAPGVASCIGVVDPSNYATPASGYPIVAVSYLLTNAKGNGLDVTHVRSLLLAPYSSTIRAATTLVGPGTGLSWLTNSQINSVPVRCVGA